MNIKKKIAAASLSLGLIAGAGLATAPAANAGSFAGSTLTFFKTQKDCEVWRAIRIVQQAAKMNGVRVSESWCKYDPKAQSRYNVSGKPWVGYVGLWRD
ncbi:hypothetical protein ACF046_13875 [Glutamicibacter creatinolyticus]|uniref:hypothetical protein n=1 Tax=Glutamicibacter creatinolyticus TaxID=162496 RepID=UPI0033D5B3D8